MIAHISRRSIPFLLMIMCLLLAACSPLGGIGGGSTTPTVGVATHAPTLPPGATTDTCPVDLSQVPGCQTPHSLRVAYGVESLIEHGFTGKGQTVVDIVSFGSPTLQKDVDAFDQQFGLPPLKIQVISPLNEKEKDPYRDKPSWGMETTLDVELIHAFAPDAGIVVLTSPVAETVGTFGLPEFRQLVQYTIDNHLGNIISNSWGTSEVTLEDQAGQQEIQKWDALLQNGSGGGFSVFYPMPTYQQTLPASVQRMLQNRRGVPDVSADADPATSMADYIDGSWTLIGGTSASAPVWAALGAIADQMAGHPLGFINPGLYKVGTSNAYTQVFHDITVGDNSVDDPNVKGKGYGAVPGWDPVTGLGSPNAEVLLPALIAALKQ